MKRRMTLSKQRIDEKQRLHEMSALERPYWQRGELVCGMDEAGRGPVAGPVVAAAVIMPPNCLIEGVNDSKKIGEAKRERLFKEITKAAIGWNVGVVDNREIDEVNILNAAKRAFGIAFRGLLIAPAFVYTDRIGGIDIDTVYEELTGGDARCYSVAAASIVAKVWRDRLMRQYDEKYPEYGFAQHKGYGTAAHKAAVAAHGVCDIHRMSFLTRWEK